MSEIIDLHITRKVYKKRAQAVTLLTGFDLQVRQGEKLAVVGESGAGKSTLLNILGLIDSDYEGQYTLFGKSCRSLSDAEMAQWRNQRIGFVLQESALIKSLTIEDNIMLPLQYAPQKSKYSSARFNKSIESIGIGPILHKKPLDCSGGEKARAVFARAIILNPELILADEPTASLDSENKQRIMELLFDLNREYGTALVTVTHESEIARLHDTVIKLHRKD